MAVDAPARSVVAGDDEKRVVGELQPIQRRRDPAGRQADEDDLVTASTPGARRSQPTRGKAEKKSTFILRAFIEEFLSPFRRVKGDSTRSGRAIPESPSCRLWMGL